MLSLVGGAIAIAGVAIVNTRGRMRSSSGPRKRGTAAHAIVADEDRHIPRRTGGGRRPDE